MADTYTAAYGAMQFAKEDGTPLFDTLNDLGLRTSKDNEPSPAVKWVRVDVPGADGAVDLSRALAGQVTYEQREIELQFSGRKDSHAEAVQLIRCMRSALHGARVQLTTALTNLAGGYYIADCECDGTAYADGTVVIDVTAWADPFIHVGQQTLTLPASTITTASDAVTNTVDSDLIAGAGTITVKCDYGANVRSTPMGARRGRIWYARGDSSAANCFDLTQYSVVGEVSDDEIGSSYSYASDVVASGHDIQMGSMASNRYKHAYITSLKRTGVNISDYDTVGIPFLSDVPSGSGVEYVGIYLTGTITSVSSPTLYLTKEAIHSNDEHGLPTGGTSQSSSETMVRALAAGTYNDELVMYAQLFDTDDPATALGIKFHGVASTNLKVRVAVMSSSADFPAHWPEPDLGYIAVDFGGTFCRSDTDGDVATVSPLGVTTTHNCKPLSSGYRAYDLSTSYETNGTLDGWLPDDAQLMCATVVNSYGEECPVCTIGHTSSAIATITGTNGTMRSTPSVTSDSGAYVSIGGETVIVPSGTQELSTLTIGGGSFGVTYATLGNTDATLTWEGGVL